MEKTIAERLADELNDACSAMVRDLNLPVNAAQAHRLNAFYDNGEITHSEYVISLLLFLTGKNDEQIVVELQQW